MSKAPGTKSLPADARFLVATARNDITIPGFTTTLRPTDSTLVERGGGRGLAIYDEILRDTHANSVLTKRALLLISREWDVAAASDSAIDQEAASWLAETIGGMSFDRLCLALSAATLKGFAVVELVWDRVGSEILPVGWAVHDQRRFVFDDAWRPRLLTMAAMLDGIELPERKIIVHRVGATSSDPYGRGLGHQLFWAVLFKREGIAFWLTFLEKFASPTPVGEYPIGTLPEQQQELLNSLVNMVQAGALTIPVGANVKFLEATRAGHVSYLEWCRYWDEQISVCVLGSNLGTQVSGGGSYAAAEVHKEIEQVIVDADADLLGDTLADTLCKWLIEYNRPGAGVPKVRRPRPQNYVAEAELGTKRAEQRKGELDNLFRLVDRLADHPADAAELVAAMNLIGDLEPDQVKRLVERIAAGKPAAPPARIPALRAGQPAAASFAATAVEPHDHGIGALADQLGEAAQPVLDAWLDRIRTEIDAAEKAGASLADFGERLLALDPELTIDPLGRVIQAGLTVTDLTGRSDVQDEMGATT